MKSGLPSYRRSREIVFVKEDVKQWRESF